MKFKQFLKESDQDKIFYWFRKYITIMSAEDASVFDDANGVSYKEYEDEHLQNHKVLFDLGHDGGKTVIETKGFEEITLNFHGEQYYCGLESSAWNKADFGVAITSAKVDGLHNVPNVEYLAFGDRCTIYSFDDEGADDLSRVQQMMFYGSTRVDGGMMRLLKSKKLANLKELICHDTGDLKRACVIINRHLKGERDVADCIDELIEAGLKQYAKL